MKPNILKELKSIANASGGLLNPETVVEAARPKSSPLHNSFTWDNTKAAHEYRLWQARKLITVCVEYIEVNNKKQEYQVFVSLEPDRGKEGGYRNIQSVMSNEDMRKQLLKQAIDEIECFERKYRGLKELAVIFSAMRKVKAYRR